MLLILTTIFSSSFLVALSGALMPGPLLTVTISETVHRGSRTGPLMICGHSLLELLLIVGLVAGLAPLINLPQVFVAISLAGGAILCWMGVAMFRSMPTISLAAAESTDRHRNLLLTGAMLSLFNPYWLIWWATIGLGYILQTLQYGATGLAAFFLGHILADFCWYTLVSLGIARGRHLFTDTHYRCLIGGCAGFLLVFSGWFFYSGFNKLHHIFPSVI